MGSISYSDHNSFRPWEHLWGKALSCLGGAEASRNEEGTRRRLDEKNIPRKGREASEPMVRNLLERPEKDANVVTICWMDCTLVKAPSCALFFTVLRRYRFS